MKTIWALMLATVVMVPACSKVSADYEPNAIEKKYGLTGAYVDEITTEDGKIQATIVPTTLEDGRKVQLVIPHQSIDSEHQVFMRDGITMTPLELSDPKLKRQDFIQSQPRVVERRPVTTTATHKKRSWEKEALIVGGGAGAGAAIGAVAGGGKGAGIGALTGGVAGLVYDLATRNKK